MLYNGITSLDCDVAAEALLEQLKDLRTKLAEAHKQLHEMVGTTLRCAHII